MTTEHSDNELIDEFKRLTKVAWDRALDIDKRRKERHERIDFDNPAYMNKIQELEKEMKKRGLK